MNDHPSLTALIHGPSEQAQVWLAALLTQDHPDVAVMGELAAGFFSAARYELAAQIFARWTELAPGNPEPWSNLGLCLMRQKQADNARAVLEQALQIDPSYAPAMNNLCDVYKELGLPDRHLEVALTAVGLQPGSALAFNNLGTALRENGLLAEAVHAFDTSLMLDPEAFEARFNKACVAADAGDHETALASFRLALAAPGVGARERELVEYHLSYVHLSLGELSAGWHGYEQGFSRWVPLSLARRPERSFGVPRWSGQPLQAGQTLMIWREQGIGDELRFATLLDRIDVGQGRVIIETEARLMAMLQRAFPQYTVRLQAMSKPDGGDPLLDDYDFHLPIGSLPSLLMNERSAFEGLGGYLKPVSAEVERFGSRLAAHAGKRIVGICWRSHKLSATRNRKYTALHEWEPILSRPDTVFVNLQYGDCEQELVAMEQALGIEILRWPDLNLKDDLEALLGLMHHLDLVITPSTAVLAFAGASGTPTVYLGHQNWVMLGERERYPWYASVHPVVVPPTQAVSSAIPEVRRRMDALLGRDFAGASSTPLGPGLRRDDRV